MRKVVSDSKEKVSLTLEKECLIYFYCNNTKVWSYLIFNQDEKNMWSDELLITLKKMKDRGCVPQSIHCKVISNLGYESFLEDNGFENSPEVIIKKFGIDPLFRNLNTKYLEVLIDTFSGELRFREVDRIEKKKTGNAEVKRPVKVMIVDDSRTVRRILESIFKDDRLFEVVGTAENPMVAEELISSGVDVDVMTLDIDMPKMSGIEYQKTILRNTKIKSIIVSAYTLKGGKQVLECLEHGAFDYIQKPTAENMEESTRLLKEKVLSAYQASKSERSEKANRPIALSKAVNKQICDTSMFLIGSSTGGVEALMEILPTLPECFPPTLVVQHMPEHFTKVFAEKLDKICPMKVVEVNQSMVVERGVIYLAAGGRQMKLVQVQDVIKVMATDDPPVNKFSPSVDFLFDSALRVKGKEIVAALLTGMGKDGAEGMLRLKEVGHHTIAQNEDTCVVYGMPGAAEALGAAEHIIPLLDIPHKATRIFNKEIAFKNIKKSS